MKTTKEMQQERKELWKAAWYECGRILDRSEMFRGYEVFTNARIRSGFADITLLAFDKRFGNGKTSLPKDIQKRYM